MARSPGYKFYFKSNYIASFKLPEDAYVLCRKYGEGSTIRRGHKVNQTIYIYMDDDYFNYSDKTGTTLSYQEIGSKLEAINP
jgi:hypothetical protein